MDFKNTLLPPFVQNCLLNAIRLYFFSARPRVDSEKKSNFGTCQSCVCFLFADCITSQRNQHSPILNSIIGCLHLQMLWLYIVWDLRTFFFVEVSSYSKHWLEFESGVWQVKRLDMCWLFTPKVSKAKDALAASKNVVGTRCRVLWHHFNYECTDQFIHQFNCSYTHSFLMLHFELSILEIP